MTTATNRERVVNADLMTCNLEEKSTALATYVHIRQTDRHIDNNKTLPYIYIIVILQVL